MKNALLKLIGGPLDGETRRRLVHDEWMVIRFEHPTGSTAGFTHVYAGCRASVDQIEIPMKYLGVRGI